MLLSLLVVQGHGHSGEFPVGLSECIFGVISKTNLLLDKLRDTPQAPSSLLFYLER
jgi:hypothetical protein